MMWLCEEEYRRKEFGIKLLSDQALDKLRNANCSNKCDSGYETYNYNILTNPVYQEKFKYLSAKVRYLDSSTDKVTPALFAAYIK